MSVRSGQSITKVFTTRSFSTGVATDATGTPTGTLYVNGTADAASVTVTNIATGVYKATVTMPTLAVGDVVDLRINATVSAVTDNAVIWWDTKDFFAGSVPDVAAGGSGGLIISGTNSGTTTLGALTVSGATTLAALSCTTLTVSGAVAFQSTFTVTTSTALAALSCTTLTASGAVAFQSTFAVTTSTSLGAFSCTTLTASGAVAFQSTFATTGTTTFNAFTVTNALTVSGATTLTGIVLATNASNDIRGVTASTVTGTVTLATSQPNYAPSKAGDAMTLTAAYDAAKTAAQAATALSTAIWTSGLATSLTTLAGHDPGGVLASAADATAIVAAVATRASATVAPSWYTAPVDVSANVTAIKAKTDQLTFTVALHVDATATIGGNVTVGAYAAGQDPATLVLDVLASAHNIANTIGAKINAAGGSADPLGNFVPGSYASGTAGYVIGHLAGTQVITVAVVATNGDVSLVRATDYYAADGRAITWTDNSAAFPDLTGATILVTVYNRDFSIAATWTATCLNPGASAQTVQLELAASQTRALGATAYPFKVVATLVNTHEVELLSGTASVGNV